MKTSELFNFVEIRDSGCWEWTRAIATNGYGLCYIAGRQVGAHRAAYEIAFGAIPDGHFVCHRCDNRRCINPDHLFAGTQRDNVQDAITKGRMSKPPRKVPGLSVANMPRGTAHHNSKLTDDLVRSIVEQRLAGRNFTHIGRDFSIDASIVADICKGRIWKHVVDPETLARLMAVPVRRNWTSGDQHWKRRA